MNTKLITKNLILILEQLVKLQNVILYFQIQNVYNCRVE